MECDTSTSGKKVTCLEKDSTGYILAIRKYKNNQKHGTWQVFEKEGWIKERYVYKNDRLKWQLFYREGKLVRSINKNGKIKNFKGCGCT